MKTVRYFLLALTITACSSTQLEAMKRQNESADTAPANPVAPTSLISLPQTYHQLLEKFTETRGSLLPELAGYILALQLELDGPIAFARKLTLQEIKSLFDKLQDESIFKTALRLVCAQEYSSNLDDLDCVDFVTNINSWVNFWEWSANFTDLFSQTYLPYVLPLLESLIDVPVTTLRLSNNELTTLPDVIGQLTNLEDLRVSGNQLTELASIGKLVNLKNLALNSNKLKELPNSIGNLVKLDCLVLSCNKLTELPDSIDNLNKLKRFDLRANEFSDDKKQVIRQQFGHLGNKLVI